MSVKFLSEDWLTAANEALAGSAGYQAATSTTDLTLQFVVTDTPDGDVEYHVVMANGATTFTAGAVEGADATIRNNHETAMAVSKGDLNTQAAFISGKLKVEGNLAKIMMNQSALTALADGLKDLDIEY
ncbi:MAG: SCP2 sterol-binding domain-containing protein [Acidimicrobiia bacterium]|nr:SCP2 sterol-binding domain-containing protein [Acidimicrobiia bacterium]